MPRILPGEQTPKLEGAKPKAKVQKVKPPTALRGLWFTAPKPSKSEAKPKHEKKAAVKNDPKLVAAARELRDRWLQRVNADPSLLTSSGKYDVSSTLRLRPEESKELAAPAVELVTTIPALPAPIAA